VTNLSEWALKHRAFTVFLMIVFTLAGLSSYFGLGRNEDPAFTFRTMVVQAAWPGATLDDTLKQVTERLERKLQETRGLDFLRSYTTPGLTTIFVNLKGSTSASEVPDVWYQVRKNIGDIRHTLPAGVVGPGFNDDFGDTFGLIYGFTADEAIGKPMATLVPGNHANEIPTILTKIAHGERVDHYETKGITKAGHLLEVSLFLSPVRDSSGAIIGAFTSVSDITAHEPAEETLRESETQYRLLFESNPLPMWVFDRKSLAFLAVNEAAVRHYGFSRNEFADMTILDIRPDPDIPRLREHMARSTRGLQKVEVWRHRKKDGSIIYVEVTAHSLDFQGREAELVLAHDITERKRDEERLRQSEERFSKAFRSRKSISLSRKRMVTVSYGRMLSL